MKFLISIVFIIIGSASLTAGYFGYGLTGEQMQSGRAYLPMIIGCCALASGILAVICINLAKAPVEVKE